MWWMQLIKQMEFLGVRSVPVLLLTGGFTGMVLALQSFQALERFGGQILVGAIASLGQARELGPILTAFLVAGRVGSAMAAELASMQISEQIDALRAMAVSPFKFLVVPRLIAGVTMLPIVTVIANFIGTLGSYLVAVIFLHVNAGIYWNQVFLFVGPQDLLNGLLKSVFFGLILTGAACWAGLEERVGAEGIGRAATAAVVRGYVLILIADYFLTDLLF
ncbi:ABC transporter permease [Candidatus Acetothermia bacterium]|nr:ABC transporter permease [Candidatus Acetothermia bacterium]